MSPVNSMEASKLLHHYLNLCTVKVRLTKLSPLFSFWIKALVELPYAPITYPTLNGLRQCFRNTNTVKNKAKGLELQNHRVGLTSGQVSGQEEGTGRGSCWLPSFYFQEGGLVGFQLVAEDSRVEPGAPL